MRRTSRGSWPAAAPTAPALSRAEVEALLTREDIPIRERTLWTMLYETAARSAEVLALDIEDLDQPNRMARVRRKGGAIDVIVWQTRTARLLPRLAAGRTTGSLFVTRRRARVQLPAADLDERGRARLSCQQAEALFSAASGGATLHQLRHSALTHDAEDGTSTPMLMARTGHTSARSLAGYARVSAEALQRHQADATLPAAGSGAPGRHAASSLRTHFDNGRGQHARVSAGLSLAITPGAARRSTGRRSSPCGRKWPGKAGINVHR